MSDPLVLDVAIGSMRFVWGDRVVVTSTKPYTQPRRAHKSTELTTREREVLELVVAGHSNEQIGADLEISVDTAKFHVANLIKKLGCASKLTAAVYAVRAGLA